ncbi:aspartyl/Asparaginyl beta-hydroxylase, putative [Phytophthora infestans T30-4]|uniref:Aspartyl/Asparaginyl beta-hydroxylase, putative n=2 Tax=Phytophthora infestans TaxID=4787 RepID=D0MZ58_PHYIT|nr:aspartyl/Asparaginyl beta-hydroxylase, putative [Phytophthora infestans T30-4]EEY65521.1 aspartyl/Asparaginyl beta-hydroxylase, putative [Phytophthora infestans T30-4]KAF4038904.1 Aspartyl/Asparaginyl beta-hydroxylase [Phytophthora infestans]|eukprot:XP_002906120.1 aspartyl/Asparaginyl beta-hydroxylase, putative [Phytophthora infestans T30-4]
MLDDDKHHIEEKLRVLVRSWGVSTFSERIALQWIERSLGSDSDREAFRHLGKWIVLQLNQLRIPDDCSAWQVGCPQLIPLLRAIPVWDCSEFPWVQTLERNFTVIKEELLSLKNSATSAFQPYRAPSWASDIDAKDGLGSAGHDAGDWNVLYLFLHNVDFQANRQLCPKTAAIIESIDGHYDHAFFSALAPRTHVKKHHGPTNKKLRCHLPLVVPEGKCRLRAGDEVVDVQEGKCFIFDDSFEHEAWNDNGSRSRIVLIIDVWHPDLSAQERKFLGFLRNAQLRMDKNMCQNSGDNFYSIIKEAGEANASRHEAVWS